MKDRGLRIMEYTDGKRNIEILWYQPKHTPAKFDGDTICIRLGEEPWNCPTSIYITWDEGLCIASGLLRAAIKDKEQREDSK
jgi:hypothetical protein